LQYFYSPLPFDGHEILNTIQDERDHKHLGWNSSIVFKMYEFVIKTLRRVIRIKSMDQNLAGTLNLGIAVSKFLHAHYAESITLEDIAQHFNFSSRHVNRAYMNIFNTSIIKNLNLIRIEYAKRYLCFTDYSVEKISEIVGFSSPRTLYKLFKIYEGVSISQFRVLLSDKLAKEKTCISLYIRKYKL
jgi:AraC-like DNA-binding protein